MIKQIIDTIVGAYAHRAAASALAAAGASTQVSGSIGMHCDTWKSTPPFPSINPSVKWHLWSLPLTLPLGVFTALDCCILKRTLSCDKWDRSSYTLHLGFQPFDTPLFDHNFRLRPLLVSRYPHYHPLGHKPADSLLLGQTFTQAKVLIPF